MTLFFLCLVALSLSSGAHALRTSRTVSGFHLSRDPDVRYRTVTASEACHALCAERAQCIAWSTHAHLGCWLHDRADEWYRVPCLVCTLGVMSDRPALSGGDTAAAGSVTSERSLPPMLPRVPRPSQVQLKWMDREVGAMVTWNLQTLCGNGPGYDHNQPCQASQYIPTVEAALQWNPAQLDLDAIMVSAKSFGATYMVWVAQHMSGFSLWNSKVSNFTLANTPWRGGGVDLMVEYVKTAVKHGVLPGVFYSAHFNWYYGVVGFETGHYAMSGLNLTQEQYNENVTRPQLLELLKNYSNLSEIWFDGGLNNTINHVPAEVINSLSPRQACHSCDGCSQDARDPAVGYGIRWVGNEEGTTPQPNWLTADNPSQGPGTASGALFAPPSCDTVLREHLWFWANNTESKLRSVETLVNVYLTSVGQGCNLILNMAPDPTGHLPDVDARQYQAMGEAVACLFQQVVANSSTFSTTGGWLPSITWQVPSASAASHMSIALWEDLTQGQLINAWVLEARAAAGDWVTLESGQTITHKRILHNMTMPASVLPLSALRLNVTSTLAQPDQEPKLRRAELFDMSGRASCISAR